MNLHRLLGVLLAATCQLLAAIAKSAVFRGDGLPRPSNQRPQQPAEKSRYFQAQATCAAFCHRNDLVGADNPQAKALVAHENRCPGVIDCTRHTASAICGCLTRAVLPI